MQTAIRTFKNIDRTILVAIPNPSDQAYEIKTKIPEFISSKLTIDPDWKARGGQEKFNNWQSIEDEWDVRM